MGRRLRVLDHEFARGDFRLESDGLVRIVATTVKCDNPACNALYETSSFLGGHTFTCKKCGGRVMIRDLSTEEAAAGQ